MDLRVVFDDLIRFEILLWNALDERLKQECDLPLGALNVMQVIERTPECRVQEVAGALEITVGGASQAVDRVERRGWCVRRPHPRNRRSSVLELTGSGREVVERAGAVLDRELASLLAEPLDADQLENLGTALHALRAAVSGGGGRPRG
ncbi:MarR family winged helix-turn-helix transcriptional regulator [Cryptosporangium phraense]|uniref:Winged helix-turn-helix transcriptional regulator n=1 Tax=Cryptosporangium phraense TaxID=2593070 RepID=A0A545ANX4_9ACTN|nr:MarR family winged helix-turn-helix transcriptional regulator [Cryptosporangium phraense]TQS43034.1 winged helix-turn-helix transcriptional regulator [Cryptosporangium phraense]